jgi:RNA polymerase sigma-70 factor (ECF subfamily)
MRPVFQKERFPNRETKTLDMSPEFTDAVYRELRRLAASCLRKERSDHTLQPTALVHEAWIRMSAGANLEWQNRAHFFGFAARIMRQVLVDHARKHCAGKRPEGGERCELSDVYAFSLDRSEELLAVDEALDRLAVLDSRQSHIVELRFFAGLSEEEIGELLDISVRTVKRDWKMAKAWLQSELG